VIPTSLDEDNSKDLEELAKAVRELREILRELHSRWLEIVKG